MLFIIACGEGQRTELSSNINSSEPTKYWAKDSVIIAPTIYPQALSLKFGSNHISGIIENGGNVSIDYPTELRGAIKLLSYNGYIEPTILPFSKDHCRQIEAMVKHGAGLIVRREYSSILNFTIPVFVSSAFSAQIMNQAKYFGYSTFYIKNSIEHHKTSIKLHLDSNAISLLNGDIKYLEKQLNLSERGIDADHLHINLKISAGDIICDLAANKARIEISYPIKGETKILKVIFDSLNSRSVKDIEKT
jgi:hypothetical protein